MAEKQYTAKQAALAVLSKAQEILKGSNVLAKAEEEHKEPKGEIHPTEHVEGEGDHPAERVEEQAAPETNPKEEAEGNNNVPGGDPQDGKEIEEGELKGHLKLAKFLGRMEHKRALKDALKEADKAPKSDEK